VVGTQTGEGGWYGEWRAGIFLDKGEKWGTKVGISISRQLRVHLGANKESTPAQTEEHISGENARGAR